MERVMLVVSGEGGCSIQNLVYCAQNINNYELIPGAADYRIISISQYSNFVLVKFTRILEF